MPISELAEARTKAEGKKLIVLLVKGSNDGCPYCVAAVDNGESAIGSGVVKVFARAESMNGADTSSYPAALKQRVDRRFTTGAAVTFLVFDPAMQTIIAEGTRAELENDRKLIAKFRKSVKDAKRLYK
jgi:hypothetical protein